MSESMKKTMSLEDLDAAKAGSEAFEFEFVTPSGDPSGLFLRVLGGQSETVTREVARLINERRRKEAAREVNKRIGVGNKTIEFEPLENDVEFGQRLAAVRLIGWRGPGETEGLDSEQKERFCGISTPWTQEGALRLCKTNKDIAAQITENSDAVENFIKI